MADAPWVDDLPFPELDEIPPAPDRSSSNRRMTSRALSSAPSALRKSRSGGYAAGVQDSFVRVSQVPQKSNVLSVQVAVERLKTAVSPLLTGWWISGEVSNYSRPYSGHVYFSLKDSEAQIRCVYFAGSQRRHPATFREGDRIEVLGEADVYVKGGELQIRLNDWRPAGQGALFEMYMRLKRRLSEEGLFALERKRALPTLVRRVAVVTSAQAAAYQDVLRTVARRMPWLQLVLVETPVQGSEAPAGIVAALKAADRLQMDAVLLVRGGGSFEDLLCFSDERVVRAVAQMHTPVVAGIGHENDESLAGLAADICASTPTAAAEQLGPDQHYWKTYIEGLRQSLHRHFEQGMNDRAMRLDRVWEGLQTWDKEVDAAQKRFHETFWRFQYVQNNAFDQRLERLRLATRHLASPEDVVHAQAVQVQKAWQRLEVLLRHQWQNTFTEASQIQQSFSQSYAQYWQQKVQNLQGMKTLLNAINPDTVLVRGYTLTLRDGTVLTQAQAIHTGEQIDVRFSDGTVRANVVDVMPRKKE